jgi:hypothetical protein
MIETRLTACGATIERKNKQKSGKNKFHRNVHGNRNNRKNLRFFAFPSALLNGIVQSSSLI